MPIGAFWNNVYASVREGVRPLYPNVLVFDEPKLGPLSDVNDVDKKYMLDTGYEQASRFLAKFPSQEPVDRGLGDQLGKVGDTDTVMVLMKTASGRQAHINNSRRAAYGYDQRLEVHGSKGRLLAGNRTPTTVELADGANVSADKPMYFFLERYAEAYRAELAAFVDAVINKKPMPVGVEDGRMAIVLAEAALKSLKTGRPVKIK